MMISVLYLLNLKTDQDQKTITFSRPDNVLSFLIPFSEMKINLVLCKSPSKKVHNTKKKAKDVTSPNSCKD